MDVEIVMWEWRDGSIHAEMRTVAFHGDDDALLVHLQGDKRDRFVTACGAKWWGKSSASGLGNSARVTCPRCRAMMRGTCATLTLNDVPNESDVDPYEYAERNLSNDNGLEA